MSTEQTLRLLVQRELLEAYPGRSAISYELQAHVSVCFGGLADLAGLDNFQFTVQVGDQRITGDTSMHRFAALQSLLDKIYDDPVASAKWTAYLERAQ